jgi:hypothetical protein
MIASEPLASSLHDLARAVAAPGGAPATYFDEREAGPERPVASEADVQAIEADLARGAQGFAVRAAGETGVEIYRSCALAARALRGRVPIRVRWTEAFGVKAAALALLFGADELVGPLAGERLAKKIAIIGGPPEDPGRPTRAHVEALIRAAGRTPQRGDRP